MYILLTETNLPINSYATIPYAVLGLQPGSNPTAAELAALRCYTFVDNPVPSFDCNLYYPSEVWQVSGTTCTRTWTAAAQDSASSWQYIRNVRDELLASCDWTQLVDAPLTTQLKADWATYRQDLRDVPQTYATAQVVVWPTAPN